jgi:tRNA-2-methylthio-N6-dimethylallyladenosine synthase
MQLPIEKIEEQNEIMEWIQKVSLQRTQSPIAYIDTYGCQQNESDSERLRGMLAQMGYGFTSDEFSADIIVINTCAIRENAENRVYGNVGALVHTKKAKPSQIIVFCGCMAAIPEVVEKIRQSYRHVDLIFAPNNIWRFPEMLMNVIIASGITSSNPDINSLVNDEEIMQSAPATDCSPVGTSPFEQLRSFENDIGEGYIIEGLPILRDRAIKAWLPIMYGCNNFCSYCIVPYVRGRERSRRPQDILDEAKKIISEGYKDITLLGQNVNSYGTGLEENTNFASIIKSINELDGEFLIRFMTSHPKDASIELFEAMAQSKKAAKHIHLPFQAGSDRILELMNRGYTHNEYLEKINAARELMPDIVITSDVIVGFPGETDEEFEDTLHLIEKA